MEYNQKTEAMGARMQEMFCDRSVMTELASDFSLPDYQPEIKRLLRITATVSPADQYIGVGNAELSGTVDYHILYAGNDGALYCANQTGEYRFSCPIEMNERFDPSDGILCDCETIAESPVGRVVAPRRLSLKCRLRSRVRMYGTRTLEERIGAGAEGACWQRLKKSAACARTFVGTSEAVTLGDEILCDVSEQNLRVISAEGCVFVHEAEAGSGCVNCRGEAMLKLLTVAEGAEALPVAQIRKIPFSASVPVEGAEVNCECIASGVCTDLNITVEDGRILCEIAIRLKARAQRNEEIEYTCDLYATNAKSECRYESIQIPQTVVCASGNVSINTVLSLEEAGIRRDAGIVDMSLTPLGLNPECENGKYVVTGRLRALAVLHNGEEYGAQEFEFPFRYEVEGEIREITDYDLKVTPLFCRARMDGERISVDSELAVAFATQSANLHSVLTEATMGEVIGSCGACYTVCYPSPEDTLWSVAKRYHRAVSDVAQMNPLSGSPAADAADSLEGVAYLLV